LRLTLAFVLVPVLTSGPVSSAPAQVISSGGGNNRVVALTFDAGADRGYAATILRTLERQHLHATFGMTGRWAQANPDLVKRIARDHDTFINHTFDHRSFTGLSNGLPPLSTAQRSWEIRQTESIVHRLTGRTTKPYFRPPFGDYDPATLRLARRLGYRYMVMWTVDSLGWERLAAAQIVSRCTSLARPGAIFLMHVGIQSQDAQALEPLVGSLRRDGYRFVTIPQLLARS
jgi:peptidoglycan/xylan/chitin deacetylase (PgdA/CDA1 family)